MKNGIEENKRMHKSLIVLAVTASVLVVAYFVYDYFKPKCGEIFEQTALNVRAKAEMIKTKSEVFIGREKVQELTSSSQKVGQHLKTCCIVLDGGKLNPDQFQRCIEGAENYEANLTKVVASLDEAQTAKQQNNPNLVKAKVEQINSELDAAKTKAEELKKQVADITDVPKPSPPKGMTGSDVTPATSAGQATTKSAETKTSGHSTTWPDVVATVTRLNKSSGMVTVEITYTNVSSNAAEICPWDPNTLIDEVTGRSWHHKHWGGHVNCPYVKTLQPGESYLIWSKYMVEDPVPVQFTIVAPGVTKPFDNVALK